ncbi:hypothetical protein [Nonomuraea sp. NPDC049141]|uniref:hypothetical protein n=1 Tax=Nonomuraea sp. NPDC049141 TaxID=3155500 RepID=UPI0033CAB086
MSRHQDLLTTKALLAGWNLTCGGDRAQPAVTLTRERWSILVLYSGDTPISAGLLSPGRAEYDTIPVPAVDQWMKCSQDLMALHAVGDRVTVGGRVGTVVGFKLEERHPAAGPWKFRLQVVYDDGVDGDPFPASAIPFRSLPGTASESPSCKGWQCEDHGALMCLTRTYTKDDSAPTERTVLCGYHAEHGDRRLTVVRVLHEIPTPAAAMAADNERRNA